MKPTRSWWRTAAIAAACLGAAFQPLRAHAQQVKPYFLVVFDTSGSMSEATTDAPSCAGYASTKLDTAKCVLRKLLSSTGDAEFGLMQFANDSTTTCGAGSCTPTAGSAWLRVPIETGSIVDVLELVDLQGTAPQDELCAASYTPLGATLVAAKDYFEGNLDYTGGGGADPAPTEDDAALGCRPLSVIVMTDGAECCDTCGAITSGSQPWEGCPKAAAATGISCDTNCSTEASCSGNSFESAPEFAYELRTESTVPRAGGTSMKEIKTYVVGLGVSEGDARIENIAKAGGTDNPKAGVSGFYADDEASLALAFSQIIADAQPPQEICNNADDDCDTLIDEGIPKYCDKPNGIDDAELCDEPDETLCDGEDDDCDGIVDEGVRNACGQCESPDETCNAVDDDCDGDVDEDLGSEACGSPEGRCEQGTLRCIAGSEQCEGEVGPRDERCNCEDDDCDGAIDEDVDGSLCPDGRCVACMCVPYCEAAEEFMPVCDSDRRPELQASGECLCVVDECDQAACEASSLMRGGELACAPGDPSVGRCACRGGACAAPCDGVTCGSDHVCDERNGRCVEDNCRGLGCAGGELCDPVTLECMADACASSPCADGEVCRAGACEASCAGVRCASDERCAAGQCVADACARVSCGGDAVCSPLSGTCVENRCRSKVCAQGLDCDPGSGQCVRASCFGVRCPSGQSCLEGQCVLATGGAPPPEHGDGPDQLWLATGAGGCACRAAPSANGASGGGSGRGVLLAGLGLLCAVRLGRRRRWARALGATTLAAALGAGLGTLGSACRVDPYCATCGASDGGSAGTSAGGAGGLAGSAGSGGSAGSAGEAGLDGGPLAPCQHPEPEVCDGQDQDCDFKLDEDAEPDVNDCNQRGVCEGSAPVCLGGEWSCRYPDAREADETLCDGDDNDCDGHTDEGHPIGDACSMGVGACAVEGELVCADDKRSVRCELARTVAPEDETCDGLDNDCDGLIDEPKSAPGDHDSYVRDDVVQVSASLYVYAYEASRPDAEDDAQGLVSERACSKPGVLPWTNVTYAEALAACEAADMSLCSAAEWQDACEGGVGCAFSYLPSGGSCPTSEAGYPDDRSACNGHDVMAAAGDPDTDALAPTGGYERCFTDHDGDGIFDLSGNAKEWTVGPDSPDENPLRGGSYNNLPAGLACDFDFGVAPGDIRLRNLGFRCCTTTAP